MAVPMIEVRSADGSLPESVVEGVMAGLDFYLRNGVEVC